MSGFYVDFKSIFESLHRRKVMANMVRTAANSDAPNQQEARNCLHPIAQRKANSYPLIPQPMITPSARSET